MKHPEYAYSSWITCVPMKHPGYFAVAAAAAVADLSGASIPFEEFAHIVVALAAAVIAPAAVPASIPFEVIDFEAGVHHLDLESNLDAWTQTPYFGLRTTVSIAMMMLLQQLMAWMMLLPLPLISSCQLWQQLLPNWMRMLRFSFSPHRIPSNHYKMEEQRPLPLLRQEVSWAYLIPSSFLNFENRVAWHPSSFSFWHPSFVAFENRVLDLETVSCFHPRY